MYLFPTMVFNAELGVKDPWGVDKKVNFVEIPVLKMNFYMMGLDSIDQDFIKGIYENVEYVNQEFEGQVKFELNNILIDPSQHMP